MKLTPTTIRSVLSLRPLKRVVTSSLWLAVCALPGCGDLTVRDEPAPVVPTATTEDELPRIVSVVSTSNTEVVVQYSATMDDSVLDVANYAIVQERVNSEVGVLRVTDAAFRRGTRRSVRLTTLSQNDVMYRLTATDITDELGRAPGRANVLHQDPTSRTFAGTPPALDDVTDTDGDGLPDHIEQRGRIVVVQCGSGDPELREVTSDPLLADTDGDGLDDLEEYRLTSDPRRADTDGDRLRDDWEFNAIYTDQNRCDSDDDGLDDYGEVVFFQTNALVKDSDGDGFSDAEELLELNRNPRLADLPAPRIEVGEVRLQLDERYTTTDVDGETRTLESSSAASLAQSEERTHARSDTQTEGFLVRAALGVSAGFEGGVNQGKGHAIARVGVNAQVEGQYQNEWSSQASESSVVGMLDTYARSLTKGEELTRSRSVTREVRGASLDAAVNLGNAGDVAFSISNLELSVLVAHPEDRTRLVPVGTLVPAADRAGGEAQSFNLGALAGDKGPIVFSNRELFPSLVEDLMRDPRGLVVRVANYDLVDEFGRNFAFSSQVALDRTANLVIDYGDGQVERYLVALNPFYDAPPEEGGELIGGFDDQGRLSGVPLGKVLERILGLPHDAETPDAILAGNNGRSDSIAAGDDVQMVVGGIEGLLDDTVVISAGENGVLDTEPRVDDVLAVTAGYETSRACGADTPSVIIDGGNGIAETLADGDDVQVIPVQTRRLRAHATIIEAGENGFSDTAPAGDDTYVGPGTPCDLSPVRCLSGTCSERRVLTRFKHRKEGSLGRFWTVLLPDDRQLGLDFEKITLRPGETLSLAFVQDLDRDGVIAQQEYRYGSSDRRQDTDGDGLDDFAEIYVGWEVATRDGSTIRRVFPDPRLPDTDHDGLSDFVEQDLRRVRCACDDGELTACTVDDACGDARCADFRPLGRECARGADASECPACPSSAIRTNPRQRDTDLDRIDDYDEVRGFLSGGGILQSLDAVLAGADGDADTRACPEDVCAGGTFDGAACRSSIDCPGGSCPSTGCDDVQVVPPGTQGLHPRAVVVAPGLDGVLQTPFADGDLLAVARDGTSETLAVGDDRQLVSRGIAAVAGQALVKPGVNGVLDSVPGGDDVALLGEVALACDPLNADTDGDLIADGVERILGSDPTDPRDYGSYADTDGDGMSDAEEATLGWLVTLDPGTARQRTRQVFSNPRVGDSDNDGLPDLAERVVGSDPTQADTDGDGLGDLDELSAEQLAELAGYAEFFRGYVLDAESSKAYGTSPTASDTDRDGFSDDRELLRPFHLTVPSEGTVRTGFTDPLRADTDADGIDDLAELDLTATDPTDPDTDDDSRLDGAELDQGTDPLVPDISVRVRLVNIELEGPGSGPIDWEFGIFAQHSSQTFRGTRLMHTRTPADCVGALEAEALCGNASRARCQYTKYRNLTEAILPESRSAEFALRAGQGIVLNGFFQVINGCDDDIPRLVCPMRYIEEPLAFETLRSQGFSTKRIVNVDGDCKAEALIEIEVDGALR